MSFVTWKKKAIYTLCLYRQTPFKLGLWLMHCITKSLHGTTRSSFFVRIAMLNESYTFKSTVFGYVFRLISFFLDGMKFRHVNSLCWQLVKPTKFQACCNKTYSFHHLSFQEISPTFSRVLKSLILLLFAESWQSFSKDFLVLTNSTFCRAEARNTREPVLVLLTQVNVWKRF